MTNPEQIQATVEKWRHENLNHKAEFDAAAIWNALLHIGQTLLFVMLFTLVLILVHDDEVLTRRVIALEQKCSQQQK